IRGRRLKEEICPMFPRLRSGWPRRGENGSFSSESARFLLTAEEENQRVRVSGSPAQAFINPRTSRTTSRASPVLRHQWRGSKGSSEAARTVARYSPVASFRQSNRTRRV